MDTAISVDHLVVLDPADIARLPNGKLFEQLKDHLGRFPFAKHVTAAPIVGDQFKNMKIGERFAWRPRNFAYDTDPSFVVDVSDYYEQKRSALDCHSSQFQRGTAGAAAFLARVTS